jgi:hypothetical protein
MHIKDVCVFYTLSALWCLMSYWSWPSKPYAVAVSFLYIFCSWSPFGVLMRIASYSSTVSTRMCRLAPISRRITLAVLQLAQHTHTPTISNICPFSYFVGRNNASASRLYDSISWCCWLFSYMHRVVQLCIRKPFSQSLKIPFVWNPTDSFFNSGQSLTCGLRINRLCKRWSLRSICKVLGQSFPSAELPRSAYTPEKNVNFPRVFTFPGQHYIDSYACCIGGRRSALVVNGNRIELRVRWTKGNESGLECVGGRNRLNEIIATRNGSL